MTRPILIALVMTLMACGSPPDPAPGPDEPAPAAPPKTNGDPTPQPQRRPVGAQLAPLPASATPEEAAERRLQEFLLAYINSLRAGQTLAREQSKTLNVVVDYAARAVRVEPRDGGEALSTQPLPEGLKIEKLPRHLHITPAGTFEFVEPVDNHPLPLRDTAHVLVSTDGTAKSLFLRLSHSGKYFMTFTTYVDDGKQPPAK